MAVRPRFYRWLADQYYFEKNIIHTELQTAEGIERPIYPLRSASFFSVKIEHILLIFLLLGREKHKLRSEVFTCLTHTLTSDALCPRLTCKGLAYRDPLLEYTVNSRWKIMFENTSFFPFLLPSFFLLFFPCCLSVFLSPQ